MDAERSTTVDDLVASVKPTAPTPEDDDPKDEAEPVELEPIDGRQLLLFAGPPLVLAAGFGLWLIAWWVPLVALAAALLGFLAWHGKLPGLKGASSGLTGGGKPGWQLGRPRGSSSLLGGSTGRSGGRGLGSVLGGRRSTTGAGKDGSKPRQTLGQRAAKVASRARDAARRTRDRVADKARAAVHKTTGGRYGKPRPTSPASSKGSTSGGKGATGGRGRSSSGGTSGGSTSSGSTDTSSGGKRKRRNPIAALKDIVKGRVTNAGKDDEKKEKPESKKKKKKKTNLPPWIDPDDDEKPDEAHWDEDWYRGKDGDEDKPKGSRDEHDEDSKPKGKGLLGAYGRLAHKIGDKVRAVDPKALAATAKDALGTPFKGLLTRKPKDAPAAEDTPDKPPADPRPTPEPDEEKATPDKTKKPPTTWDDAPPPPTEGDPAPPRRFLDDDLPELPEIDELPTPRRPPTYDDNPPPVRHAAYREPRDIPTHDDWINPGPSGTRAHAPAPTEKARRSTTMTVTATGAPIANGTDEKSTPDSRAARWERMAESEDADARVFSLKAEEFQETIDLLKARENRTLAWEEEMREAQQGKAECEEQMHARAAAAQHLRNKAQEERSQKDR